MLRSPKREILHSCKPLWYRCLSSGESLTHISSDGKPCMVDISHKSVTARVARARGSVYLPTDLAEKLNISHNHEILSKKGPVLSTAIVAGVMAVKKTSDLIPFCHPIPITDCNISMSVEKAELNRQENFSHRIQIDCTVKTIGQTGVEMEALVGVTNSALCIYDMLKALSHNILIDNICLVSKEGGKSNFNST